MTLATRLAAKAASSVSALPGTAWLRRTGAGALIALSLAAGPVRAAAPQPGPPITIRKAGGPIVIDGDLSDAGWQGIEGVTTWFETRVGDNVEPQVRNVGYLAYDDKYLYAAFRFDDPDPKLIRAPLGDHDALSGTTDYGGIIVDSRNDGKTAQMFLANANGLQYDAISSDVSGEDNSPDWYWDTAGKITDTGYTLEIRVPFSSLRYSNTPAPTWGILLYRNYPRERHYQFFSSKLPRDVNCMVCNSSKMSGLSELPHGSHLVVAPFATTQQTAFPASGLGSPLKADDIESKTGLDVKWSPLTGLAIDGTVKPDFSQVEADAGQIVANERFALFVPEKRSFFLEGVDLFATPSQAVYTRTINAPDYGVRATGRVGATAFTTLYARDRGDGIVILPGPEGNGFALQNFHSDVVISRARHDFGQSFVSALGTFREAEGGAHNRVFGPDFQWRPKPTDTFTGQILWSDTRTPNRPDLVVAPNDNGVEWDGRTLQDRSFVANWSHGSPNWDLFTQVQDVGREFRADEGFIPQVGYREGYLGGGYTLRPEKSFFSRVRCFSEAFVDEVPDGPTLRRHGQIGIGADGRYASFLRIELNGDQFHVADGRMLDRFRPRLQIDASPTRTLNNLSLVVASGQEIDFDNSRRGTGTDLSFTGTWRPDFHTALGITTGLRWLSVDAGAAGSGRLFTAQLERVRATYMFNSRMFLRVIGQYLRTDRDPALYTFSVRRRSSDLSTSALFAYKVNFQTVMYAGYGDQRLFSTASERMEPGSRQAFAKVSYAWQM